MVLPALFVGSALLASCEDQPDRFELACGTPTISYIRPLAAESADSLITGAYLSNNICLVGSNLKSIKEIIFNDQKAVLNTSYMNDNTLIVGVPGKIPSTVTDKMYLITADGDTIAYPFKTLVPAPSIESMSNEYLEVGKSGSIVGDYFVDYADSPIEVSISGVEIPLDSVNQYGIYFKMPEGVEEGSIKVKTLYGTTISKFHYKETRNMLFDNWGITSEEGTNLGSNGWANNTAHEADEWSIAGAYYQLGDGSIDVDETATTSWPQYGLEMDYVPGSWDTPEVFPETYDPSKTQYPRLSSYFDYKNWQNLALKFELCVPASNPWSSGALQMIFSGDDQITCGAQNNTWWRDLSDDAKGNDFAGWGWGRALYHPWTSTESKSFDTGDEWITVTLPLATAFSSYLDGSGAKKTLDENHLTGLTFMLYSGGVTGTACKPILKIDNVRVVPIK